MQHVPPFTIDIAPDTDFVSPRVNAADSPSVYLYFRKKFSLQFQIGTIQFRKWTAFLLRSCAWLLLIFFLFLSYGILPNRWYRVLYVSSGSMSPTINPGDLVIITPPEAPLELGMVLTMRVNGALVTHRLISVDQNGQLITKGDANSTPDIWSGKDIEIGGIVRGHIPYLGFLANVTDIFELPATGSWFIDQEKIHFEISSSSWVIPTPDWVESTQIPQQPGTFLEADMKVENICKRLMESDENGDPWRDFPTIEQCEYDPQEYIDCLDDDSEECHIRKQDHLELHGQICMENTGEVITNDLDVLFLLKYTPDGKLFEDLPDGLSVTFQSEQIAPHTRVCVPFELDFVPVDEMINYKIKAHVTITNHSGWLPGGPQCSGSELCVFGPQLNTRFALDEEFELLIDAQPKIPLLPTPTMTQTPIEESIPRIEPSLTPQPTLTPVAEESPTEEVPVEQSPTPEETPSPTSTPVAEETPTEVVPTEQSPAPEEIPPPTSTPVMEETPTEEVPVEQSPVPEENPSPTSTPVMEETPTEEVPVEECPTPTSIPVIQETQPELPPAETMEPAPTPEG